MTFRTSAIACAFLTLLGACGGDDGSQDATTFPSTSSGTSSPATEATSEITPSSETDPETGDTTGEGESGEPETSTGSSVTNVGSTGCGDIDNDPLNCGECGNVCGAPDNGAAECNGGECAVDCDGGYFGVTVGGDARCSHFGGFYMQRDTLECEAMNPFTGDCTCPDDFDERDITSWRIAPGDGTTNVRLVICSPLAGTPEGSWGGVFATNESSGGTCSFTNPFNVPLCACAAGYTETAEWMGTNINGDTIRLAFCTAEPPDNAATFRDAFTPACGGMGMCPAGTTQADYPTVPPAGCTVQSSFCYDG